MKIFNTMSRSKEEFVPIKPGKVSMYVCGPTVYNLIHIGNARPMIVFDTVRRYFEYKGYKVNYVSNFTDVDDKIIKKALEEGVDSSVISERYIMECKKDMASLNIRPATMHPRATREIGGMIDMIQTLIDKGYAYVAEDGTVYYSTRKFDGYGKLSHKDLDNMRSGNRDLKVTGADLYEIVPAVPYTAEDLNYNDRSTRATSEQDHPENHHAYSPESVHNRLSTNVLILANISSGGSIPPSALEQSTTCRLLSTSAWRRYMERTFFWNSMSASWMSWA